MRKLFWFCLYAALLGICAQDGNAQPVPQFQTGSGNPSGHCGNALSFYVDTATGNWWTCHGGTWVQSGGGGGSGTVTSATCGTFGASWLTCSMGSSTTVTPVLALSATTGQTSHHVLGTCGSAISFAPCSLVADDLPSIPLSTGVNGTLPAANLPAPAGGGPPGGVASITSATGSLSNGETTVVSYLVPGGSIQAGTTYRFQVYGTCTSSAASNASHFYIRYGSADSSSDTALYSPTLTSTTGASGIPFSVDVLVTFQSATVAQAQYRYLQTGASGLAAQAVTEGTPNQTTGLTTTGNNYLQLSLATSATTTSANIYLATIELVKP